MISLLDLPNELLMRIMKYCEFRSFMSLSETCKRFNELLSQSSCLMNDRILFELDPDYDRKVKFLMKSKRTYTNLKLGCDYTDYRPKRHFPILKKFGKGIKQLEIFRYHIKADDFASVLDYCSNVETLKMQSVYFDERDDGDYSKHIPKVEKLKDLLLVSCNMKIFKFKILSAAQLTDLTLRYFVYEDYLTDFLEFFKTQEKLESFALEECDTSSCFSYDFPINTKSQLKKLRLFNCDGTNQTNMSQFLKGQINLVEVSIIGVNSLLKADYDHLITKNPKLKKLTVDIRHYITNNRQCTSVKNLNVVYDISIYENEEEEDGAEICNMSRLITEFPNVEVLKLIHLPNLDHQTLQIIANTMMNLTELKIYKCTGLISFVGIKFPSLKSLYLKISCNLPKNSFKSLLENNKQITHLEIVSGYGQKFTDNTIQLIANNLENLETLIVTGDIKFTQNTFLMIAENLKKLKVLKITASTKKFISQKNGMAPLNSIPGLKVFVDYIDNDKPQTILSFIYLVEDFEK